MYLKAMRRKWTKSKWTDRGIFAKLLKLVI